MTVSTTTTKNSYSANGTLHSFAYGFKIFADADLTVIVRSATGGETTKTLNTHYVVTNAGSDSGGNVLFKFNTGSSSDAHFSSTDQRPANGETVVILRTLAKSQGTDYVENDPFPSTSHEDALDRLTFITQELQEEVDRTIKLSKTNTMTSPEFTTSATDRASKILAFDSSGELSVTQELGTFKGDSATTTTAAFVQRDIIKATTTAQLNNIYICVADSVIGDALTDTDHFELLVDAVSAAASATTATTKASEASSSASTATTKASEALTSASNAATTLTTFQRQYHGAASSDPSSNLDAGDLYFKTDGSGLKVYNGSAWEDIKPTSSEQTNINTVAGANSNISALAASAVITDMGILATSDNVTNMATLATSDIIADLNTLATSDIVTDMNLLATSANVTAMGLLGTSANVTAMGLLGTSAVVTDMGLLGTAAVVEDMGLLATTAVIEDMGLLATSANVTNMATLGASGVVTNIATVATNVSGVNSFADRYRVASSAPSSSLDVGDLYFDTTANELKVYKSSGWAAAGSTVNGTSARFHYDIGSAVTSVTGSDANGNTLAYDAGFCDVYVNGVRMSTADITITSGDTVTFASALADGDEVDIVAFGTFSVSNIVSTGALNSGSITSGFGSIDTGSSTITTTGAVTTGALSAKGGAVFNEDSADVDLRVESNDSANMFFINGGNNQVGIGLDPSAAVFHVETSTDGTGVSGDDIYVAKFYNREATDSRSYGVDIHAGSNSTDQALRCKTHDGGTQLFLVKGDGSATVANGLTLTDGNLVVASGHGIDFSATGNVSGTSHELLDDYEEGTFTIALTGCNVGGLDTTAYYTKIGQQVFFNWYSGQFDIANASGVAGFSGLPFQASNNGLQYGLFHYVHGTAIQNSSGGYIAINGTTGNWVTENSVNGPTFVNGSGLYIMISGSYQTDS